MVCMREYTAPLEGGRGGGEGGRHGVAGDEQG